jgi:murein L,D-transpeptidase YcbB/YkuD
LKRTLIIIISCILLCSCNWFKPKPEIALVLAKRFNDKRYHKFDTVAYHQIFNKKLEESLKDLSNPKVTKGFYHENGNNPVLVTRFYDNSSLDSLKKYLFSSKDDGFNPELFQLSKITSLLQTLNANQFKSMEEVYPVIADLELRTADALLKYSTFIKYGCVNPKKFNNRFYIKLKQPDSLKLDSMLNTKDLVKLLSDVQPTSKAYKGLKLQLAFYRDSLKTDQHPSIQTIKVNLERLRWQLPIQTNEKVVVNIPDFSLTWFNKEDTLAHMNVCVGGKREKRYREKMKAYLKSGKLEDKPRNHETPQLVSMFNSIQVNPIWNIPISIARSEIYYQALRDPYYIKVYFKGKPVGDPDTIQWRKYAREKLPFEFKQGSGGGNALGKFKFIFESSSSIYLHDTNNKNGFNLANRAISHGCVRIEQPLKFAQLMVKSKYQYDQLRMEVNLPPINIKRTAQFQKYLAKKTGALKPSWFSTRKNVAVVIAYYTAWAENGKVEFRPDVYDYDGMLWQAMKKYME